MHIEEMPTLKLSQSSATTFKRKRLLVTVVVFAGLVAIIAIARSTLLSSALAPTGRTTNRGVLANRDVLSMRSVPLPSGTRQLVPNALPKGADMSLFARMSTCKCCKSCGICPKRCGGMKRSVVVGAGVDPTIQDRADALLASNKVLICPAIQTANLAEMGPEIKRAMDGGADIIHWDIMDGHFTEKLTMGPMFVKSMRKYGITAPFDVHLVADDIVDHLVKEFADAGANYITFHPEGCKHLDRTLSMIKDMGLKCGLVINPGTPLSILESVMDQVDIILLMSVNPGFKGQPFKDITYSKAKAVKEMIRQSGRKIRLEVDGRVGTKNIEKLADMGCDMFVVGGAIFNSDDYGQTISQLRYLAENSVSVNH
ncbi:hypothetical protein AAMO2058_000831000 [Amorphochlora amoebiformis]